MFQYRIIKPGPMKNCEKYGINSEEQKFISTMVRPLENYAN